ncbi:MAG: proline--tRNA ligase [Candidatus Marsarchaeota archaeon]|jgi:prolyl-tRNA synthetase|nr:proline--tRNA ligase [Candidatus Marsarchaeota archaeon]
MEKIEKQIKKDENFSEWYVQAVMHSGLFDYGEVSGTLIFRPDGYYIWESIQKAVDPLFKEIGIQNVYFPLFIPKHFLEKEKEHIEGFSAEVAWVTKGGQSELEEELAVRPTSETIMYPAYSKWIRSWRDLPMRYNQWNNVVRWEFKHPTPLLRSREFLWNEGHTVFATREEAAAERDQVLGIYKKVLKEYLALEGIVGQKTDSEKFAGAENTFSIEFVMPDGRISQGPDFHIDGQKFSKAFDITFLDKEGKRQYVYQNTFAISTRMIGIMLGMHGDDKGVIIPPKLARIQVVVVPIYSEQNKAEIIKYADGVKENISKDFRVFVDDSDAYSPGWKFNEWERAGVPVRIEIGKKEMESNSVTLFRRDTFVKESVQVTNLAVSVSKLLQEIHENLYQKSKSLIKTKIIAVENYEKLKDAVKSGYAVKALWCGDKECEAKIKEETAARSSNIPFGEQENINGVCVYCGKPAKHRLNFGKSY